VRTHRLLRGPRPRPGRSQFHVHRGRRASTAADGVRSHRTDKLTGTRKQVFDAPEIADGTVLHQARMFFVNYQEMYKTTDADLRAVLVIRHEAIPMVLNDAMWAKYPFIGQKTTKLKDTQSGMWTKRNPLINLTKGDQFALVWTDGGMDSLMPARSCSAIWRSTDLPHRGDDHQSTPMMWTEFTRISSGCHARALRDLSVIRGEEGGCNYIRSA
jgi:hypothetical protein